MNPTKFLINNKAVVVVALVFFFGCNFRKPDTGAVTSLRLVVNYPVVDMEKNKLVNLKDTVLIYYLNDHSLYALPSIKTEENDSIVTKNETIYKYFLFKTSDKEGRLYSSLIDTSIGIVLSKDSFLFRKAYNISIDSLPIKLLSSARVSDVIIEEYLPNVESYNEGMFDSVKYYYSSKFNDFEYSFSPKKDSIHKAKLFKIRIVFNKKLALSGNFELPQRVFSFEIQKNNGGDVQAVSSFMKKKLKNK